MHEKEREKKRRKNEKSRMWEKKKTDKEKSRVYIGYICDIRNKVDIILYFEFEYEFWKTKRKWKKEIERKSINIQMIAIKWYIP